jgi:hypothetical protein
VLYNRFTLPCFDELVNVTGFSGRLSKIKIIKTLNNKIKYFQVDYPKYILPSVEELVTIS